MINRKGKMIKRKGKMIKGEVRGGEGRGSSGDGKNWVEAAKLPSGAGWRAGGLDEAALSHRSLQHPPLHFYLNICKSLANNLANRIAN